MRDQTSSGHFVCTCHHPPSPLPLRHRLARAGWNGPKESRYTVSDDKLYCQYGRCGGKGKREVKRKRIAREALFVDGRLWLVCESCADLLLRDERARGRKVERVDFTDDT